ncbi:hypothetical protein [Streptomyces sp. NPDC007083]|uniref:hypothetical protein n=1 Tax=unclassified Streptomyces TaxID=2593676 RepID=UPI0033ED053C
MPTAPAAHADPSVERVETAVYTVPTDGPEGEGTLAWSASSSFCSRGPSTRRGAWSPPCASDASGLGLALCTDVADRYRTG